MTENQTMRELFVENGYDPDELTHPRDVHAGDISDDSKVIAYTVVRNPDPDAPATTYSLETFDIHDVVPVGKVSGYTDGAVRYPEDTPATHGVAWAYRRGHTPKFQSIGYGDEMYGSDSDNDDPLRWNRTAANVRLMSADFLRFKL